MKHFFILVLLFLSISFNGLCQSSETNHWESVFNADAQFKYWSSNRGNPGSTWRTQNFNDDNWPIGKGGIGYGDDDDGTIISACNSVAIRHSFNIIDKSELTEAWFYIDYDDAFVAYINGTEIARSEGLSEDYPSHSTLSSSQHDAGTRVEHYLSSSMLEAILVNGENVFALQVHNATATSTDLSSSSWFIVGINRSEDIFQAVPEWFEVAFKFTTSNIPILIIDTENNANIPDEPKLTAHMKIINNASGINSINDTPTEYNGTIGIELRGNSTKGFPKKPYNLETRNAEGENFNVPLFGWPKENDWVLRASYMDHTFIRNGLADYLSRLNGFWAPRTQLVEVVLNGNYQGIYVFMEDIKPDKGRVDIATLNPDEITAPDITGGYIWEITGFNSNFGESRKLKYPAFDEAPQEQIDYIQNFDNQFRSLMHSRIYADSLNGYSHWINVESFVNEILVQEAIRNSDSYGWSGYFHKDKEGKINAGPVWDFDQSAGNSSYPDNGVVEGWMFQHWGKGDTPFFWPRLFEDPVFTYAVRHRWETLRETVYSNESLFAYIDSIATLLSVPQKREFSTWPVLGANIWRETSGFQTRDTYQKEVDYMKSFLSDRWAWMDDELKQYENPYPNTSSEELNHTNQTVLVYPNPVKNNFNIRLNNDNINTLSVDIFNSTGTRVQTEFYNSNTINGNEVNIQLNKNYHPGIYILNITINNEQCVVHRFLKTEY